jgi:phosphosulfolactate phosphohydrolase-like enzyme
MAAINVQRSPHKMAATNVADSVLVLMASNGK